MNLLHKYANVDGTRLHYVEAAPTNKSKGIMLFLHGFPEYWASWQQQLSYFSDSYRVIAPDLMGYNLSDKPTDLTAYQVSNLISLYASFIQQISADQKVILVAHDWGGAIAWPLVAFHKELFDQLVILNAAHPSTFTREMIHNPQQRAKSAYIHQLIAEGAEQLVMKDNFAFLREMIFENMQVGSLPDEFVLGYLTAWRQPGAVQAMLNYYKAMPQLASEKESDPETGPLTPVSQIKIPQIRIHVPTLILWGEQDKAFVPELLVGIEEYVPDIQIERFANATHWLHHEYPDEVNSAIAIFLTTNKNGL